MGDIYFDIAATVILLLTLFIFYYKKFLHVLQSRIFAVLLKISLISVVLDFSTVILNRNSTIIPLPVLYLANTLFYVFHNSIPFTFTVYILSVTGKTVQKKKWGKIILVIPWIATLLVILTNPFTHAIFFFNNRLDYTRGPLLPFLYLTAVWYVGYSIYYTLLFRNAIPTRTIKSIFTFIAISLIPIIIQFFLPNVLMQGLGVAISTLVILLTVQSPEEFVDSGTGLFNRTGFASQINLLRLNKTPFHVILIAVENVPFLRRTFGLQYFSLIMREISRSLAKDSYEDRIVATPGEAQFALILRGNGFSKPTRIQYIISALQERFRLPWIVEDRPITLSIRICHLHCPEDTDDVSEIIRSLEQLSRINATWPKGKTLRIADLGLADKKREAEIERAIRRGLENNSFRVYYQPIYSTAEKRIVSAEALVRLFDPEYGFIPPDQFIPVSEHNGTIHKIGSFVLNTTCAFMKQHDLEGKGIKYIEINLSVSQCIQPDLPTQVSGIAGRHQIRSDQICLEITETAAASSPEKLVQNLKIIAAAGFPVAVDDYGTGYSNIKYLMELPFSYAKLDRSMVTAWSESEKGRITLEGTIAMFKRMNLKIIAEGVETAEQVQMLTERGCDYLQGYYFSKAVPAAEFLELIKERQSGVHN